MEMLKLSLLVVFLIATPYGYYKNDKNIMLIGSLALFAGFFGIDFTIGYIEGIENIPS